MTDPAPLNCIFPFYALAFQVNADRPATHAMAELAAVRRPRVGSSLRSVPRVCPGFPFVSCLLAGRLRLGGNAEPATMLRPGAELCANWKPAPFRTRRLAHGFELELIPESFQARTPA